MSHSLDKEKKKQIKDDIAELRKLLAKDKPDKMTSTEISDIRGATGKLEASSANLADFQIWKIEKIKQRKELPK